MINIDKNSPYFKAQEQQNFLARYEVPLEEFMVTDKGVFILADIPERFYVDGLDMYWNIYAFEDLNDKGNFIVWFIFEEQNTDNRFTFHAHTSDSKSNYLLDSLIKTPSIHFCKNKDGPYMRLAQYAEKQLGVLMYVKNFEKIKENQVLN